jgi:hypothetical protein
MNVTIDGRLVEGPTSANEAPLFPSGSTLVPFTLNAGSSPKPAQVSTGAKVRTLASPNAFVSLSGVGATDDVTQADTIYIRVVQGGFQFRVTYHNPNGSPIVSVLPSAGLIVLEPDAEGGYYVTLLEAQGAGQVEYFASGPQ